MNRPNLINKHIMTWIANILWSQPSSNLVPSIYTTIFIVLLKSNCRWCNSYHTWVNVFHSLWNIRGSFTLTHGSCMLNKKQIFHYWGTVINTYILAYKIATSSWTIFFNHRFLCWQKLLFQNFHVWNCFKVTCQWNMCVWLEVSFCPVTRFKIIQT